jgi:hypothetical protein
MCRGVFGGRSCGVELLNGPDPNDRVRPVSRRRQSVYTANGKKMEHRQRDDGTVFGRRFARSLSECMEFCRQAGSNCFSVNFGRMGNRNVCELQNVKAPRNSRLYSWLVNKPGWKYSCCVN